MCRWDVLHVHDKCGMLCISREEMGHVEFDNNSWLITRLFTMLHVMEVMRPFASYS